MKIIALDGNENQAAACVRSLARAGHRVIVGATTAWSKDVEFSSDLSNRNNYNVERRRRLCAFKPVIRLKSELPGVGQTKVCHSGK
jgi:predicted dinucleotide-binding enzyme